MAKDILFISTNYMKQNSVINDNVDDQYLIPNIVKAQDLYLEPILGTDLYQKLRSDITAGSVTGAYKTLVDNHVQKTVREWALYEATISLNYKYTNKSISLKSSDNSAPAENSEIVYLREQIRNTAEYYSERMTKYLCANESSFPEYRSNADSDDIRPNSASDNFFNGLSLEPDYMTRKNRYNGSIGYYNEPDCDDC